MSAYSTPQFPIYAWLHTFPVGTVTVTANGITSSDTTGEVERYGFGTLGGTIQEPLPSADSIAEEIGGIIAGISGGVASGVWTYVTGETGAYPKIRVDIATTGATSTAPTMTVTSGLAAALGISGTVTATALAATPTTSWRFEFGPPAGLWAPAVLTVADTRDDASLSFATGNVIGTAVAAVSWGARVARAMQHPYVYGANCMLYRRQDSTFATPAQVSTSNANNLLEGLWEAARDSKTIRCYRTIDEYRSGRVTSAEFLRSIRSAIEADAALADRLVTVTLPFTDADDRGL